MKKGTIFKVMNLGNNYHALLIFFLKKLSINLEFPVFISDKRSICREFELNHFKVIKHLLLFVLFYS